MVKVEVIQEKWGNYKKGDTFELHESTAKGCIANKAVKIVDGSAIESKDDSKETDSKGDSKKKKGFLGL